MYPGSVLDIYAFLPVMINYDKVQLDHWQQTAHCMISM